MVRKSKEEIKPLVAKKLPGEEEHKRSLVSSFVTSSVTDSVTENGTKKVTNNVTDSVTKDVTKPVTKKAMITKSVTIGKKEIVAKFESNNSCRPNYSLSRETVEKIEKVSELLGYKKAEFLDIYLNGTLTKILKKLEKEK